MLSCCVVIFQNMLQVVSMLPMCLFPFLCVWRPNPPSPPANNIHVSVFVFRPHAGSLHRRMVVLFVIEKTKPPFCYGCSHLAARSTQQHFSLYIHIKIFTLNKIISTSFNNSINYLVVLYMKPVLWWHAWERWMVALQFPLTRRKEMRTSDAAQQILV